MVKRSDLVFAKVKGHSPWILKKVSTNQFKVVFFGTKQISTVCTNKMARARGGKGFNSRTRDPAVAQDSTQLVKTVSPSKDKSKLAYVCTTCSKEYVLRDRYLAHTVAHTREKLKNIKPKRQHQQHQIHLPPATPPSSVTFSSSSSDTFSSPSSTTVAFPSSATFSSPSSTIIPSTSSATISSAVSEEVDDTSLSVSSTSENVQGRKLTASAAQETKLGIFLENPSSNFSCPPSTSVTSATLDKHEGEFDRTCSSLSSRPSGPKSSFSSLPSIPVASDTLDTREDKREFHTYVFGDVDMEVYQKYSTCPSNTEPCGIISKRMNIAEGYQRFLGSQNGKCLNFSNMNLLYRFRGVIFET